MIREMRREGSKREHDGQPDRRSENPVSHLLKDGGQRITEEENKRSSSSVFRSRGLQCVCDESCY